MEPMSRTVAVLAGAMVFALVAANPAQGARDTVPSRDAPSAPLTGTSGATIRDIQDRLRGLKLYTGAVDGRTSRELTDAIQRFQKAYGLDQTGVADAALLRQLDNKIAVKRLERQLDTSRDQQTAAAEQALISSGVLASIRARTPARPDPTPAEAAECFKAPAPRCLLRLALHGARAVEKSELREWAYGDIVATQTRAGLGEDADATIPLLTDPRSILLTLRAVAESHARAGRFDAAAAAAAAIPDALRRIEAHVAIAVARIEAGDKAGALASVASARDDLKAMAEPDPRLVARLGAASGRAGDPAQARELFALATRDGLDAGVVAVLAEAMAEAGDPEAALARAEGIADPAIRDPVHVAVVSAFARRGDLDAARHAADRVGAERYRSVALAALAMAAAGRNRWDEARDAATASRDVADQIKMSYAKAYAQSRAALALSAIGDHRDAVVLAREIKDAALRAHALGTIATALPADDPLGRQTVALTDAALAAVHDPVARTRTLCGFAGERHAAGDQAGAQRQAHRALSVARGISDPWARARALIAVAGTLIDFTRPPPTQGR